MKIFTEFSLLINFFLYITLLTKNNYHKIATLKFTMPHIPATALFEL